MINANLQKAIDNLKIKDVYVRDLIASCNGDFNPKYAPDIDKLQIQQLHWIKQANVVEIDDETRFLQAFVRVGIRWIDPEEKNEEISVRATIEAEFIAEYEMGEKLDQACVDEFCLKNASYHVWPYWRELLSSQCVRMNLPKLVLPTVQLAQNRHQSAEK